MPSFKEMNPDDVWRILDATDEKGNKLHQDVLSGLTLKEEAVFRNTSCPNCGAYGTEQFVNPRRPFSPGSPLPNKLLRCTGCRAEFDPYTRMITLAPAISERG